jgi:glycosyltransferase involved in cell wall biosynthesis
MGIRLFGAVHEVMCRLDRRAIRQAQRRLDALAAQGCRFLICIPYLKSGGAERVAANLTKALTHLYGADSVAILVTDWSGLVVRLFFPENSASNYPPDIRFTNIVSLSHTPQRDRVWELMTAVLSMRPDFVLNVNSDLMWQCFERFGPELAKCTRLGTVAFGDAADKGGRPIGYSVTHLERLLPYLSFVISDNQTQVEQMTSTFIGAPAMEKVLTQSEWAAAKMLTMKMDATKRDLHDAANYLHRPSRAAWSAAQQVARTIRPQLGLEDVAKFRCIYQFAPLPSAPRRKARCERPQILWASRVSRQKFPEILPRLARLLPHCDIHVHGAREFGYRFPTLKNMLLPQADLGGHVGKAPNLYWHGGYKSFTALPLERFDAMLYTSLYDGLPNVLLEAGVERIPIIAPTIGGIGDLIDATTGWPVANCHDPQAYADQVRAMLQAPDEAAEKADRLARVIRTRHSFESFCEAVRELVEGAVRREVGAPKLRSVGAD